MIEKKELTGCLSAVRFFAEERRNTGFRSGGNRRPLPFFPILGRWAQDAVFGEKTVLNKYELFRADLDNAVGNAV